MISVSFLTSMHSSSAYRRGRSRCQPLSSHVEDKRLAQWKTVAASLLEASHSLKMQRYSKPAGSFGLFLSLFSIEEIVEKKGQKQATKNGPLFFFFFLVSVFI